MLSSQQAGVSPSLPTFLEPGPLRAAGKAAHCTGTAPSPSRLPPPPCAAATHLPSPRPKIQVNIVCYNTLIQSHSRAPCSPCPLPGVQEGHTRALSTPLVCALTHNPSCTLPNCRRSWFSELRPSSHFHGCSKKPIWKPNAFPSPTFQ